MSVRFIEVAISLSLLVAGLQPAFAHHELGDEQHSARTKTLKKSAHHHDDDPWHLFDFAMSPAYALTTNVRIFTQGQYRIIDSNGIPNHPTGQFPNAENPNTISEQSYEWRMAKEPTFASTVTALFLEPFGVAVNGVPFDPGANEFWNRDRSSGWQYEPMFKHSLGLDQSNAHVQPNGAYHYHGLPTGLLEKLAKAPHPVLIGYAADGFPIYAPYGYRDAKNTRSGMTRLRSSYRVKGGTRPSGPGGKYDGSFVQDYEYVANLGDLDQCNGRFGATNEYPQGIYHYIVTDTFPFIPRQWKGKPDPSFLRHGHTGGGGGREGGFPPGGGPGGGREGGFPPGGGPGCGREGGFPPGGGPGGFGGRGGSGDEPWRNGPGGGFPPGGPNGDPGGRPPWRGGPMGGPNGGPPRGGPPNGDPSSGNRRGPMGNPINGDPNNGPPRGPMGDPMNGDPSNGPPRGPVNDSDASNSNSGQLRGSSGDANSGQHTLTTSAASR